MTPDVVADDKEMISQKTKRWIAAAILLLGAILVTHRLWYEFKSLPVHCAKIEPLSQDLYERLSKLNSPVPTNLLASSLSSYPDPMSEKTLASFDLAYIRFNLASTDWRPFNYYHISVYSKTNVVVDMDDDRGSSVVFTKKDDRWSRKVLLGHIDKLR